MKRDIYIQKWKTHIFHYKSKKSKRKSKCINCGITFSELSNEWWKYESSESIITCNEFIIKSIIE